jgi:hypothetical protein
MIEQTTDLATIRLFGDPLYVVEKIGNAIEALDTEGTLAEGISAAWTGGLMQLGGDTIPKSWTEVRETYERIRHSIVQPRQTFDKSIAALAPGDLTALANEIRHLHHQITQRTRPN